MRLRLHRLAKRLRPTSIEPSCGVLDKMNGSVVERRIMVDCGLIPNFKPAPGTSPWHTADLSILNDGKKIDALCITHVHGDHFGYSPAVVSHLAPGAHVFMTRPSAAMAKSILDTGIDINSKRGTGDIPYDWFERTELLDRISRSIIEKPGAYEIFPDITMLVDPRAHIPGACSYTFRINGLNIDYSGDECSQNQPGVRGMRPRPVGWEPDIMAGTDCTYGADIESDNRTWRDEMDRGYDLIAETMKRGHPVIVFTFSIHRGGALAHEMARRGLTDLGPVCLDGSARDFAELMTSADGRWCDLDEPLNLAGITMIKGHEMREEIASTGCFCVITTPGFGGPGGPGTWWRRHVLPNSEGLAVFSGYVPEDCDGALMLAADREREATGAVVRVSFEVEDEKTKEVREEVIPIRARVVQIRVGSHDSRGNIIRRFRETEPEVLVLNHGSKAALDSLEEELRGEIPLLFRADKHQTVEVDT